MELVVRKNDLLRELQFFQGIVERKNTIPILANVLIRKTGNQVELTTSDLEIQVRTTVQFDGDGQHRAFHRVRSAGVQQVQVLPAANPVTP